MPFKSAAQEVWMMINKPALYKEWKRKYGHHPKFNEYMKKLGKKHKKGKKKR